ncbi:hypothetical protein L5515_010398 [Caenorhabditis briggsae]|uniref:Uncharacterized protein n=1 Tax=Caenorhabditis briggsae TaxID=6238 RepID=A0AAE9ELY7_CAEBR|nr:hypothetical protein L5515_010398 [Caenorhabditis briggsae]
MYYNASFLKLRFMEISGDTEELDTGRYVLQMTFLNLDKNLFLNVVLPATGIQTFDDDHKTTARIRKDMIASIAALFESRFYTVCKFAWKPYWKRWRRTGIIFYHTVLSTVVLSFGFMIPDQETAKRNMFAKLPCLPQYIYEANNFVLCEDCTYHLVCCVALVISACAMGVSFVVLLMWNAVVQLRSRTMSQKTFQLQKAFLIALGIQILVPLCTLAIPGIYLWIALMLDYYNQAFTNCAVCLFSIHGFLSSMVMTLVHRPYRETFFSLFPKKMTPRSEENPAKRLVRYNHNTSVGIVTT